MKHLVEQIFATSGRDKKELISVAVDVEVPPFPALSLPDSLGAVLKMMEISAFSANFGLDSFSLKPFCTHQSFQFLFA